MSRDIDYYEKKVRDLQIENEVLRGQLANSSKNYGSIAPQTIIELGSRNERMERTASKYEKSLKMDLSCYLVDSMVQGQCYFRNRYAKLISQPRNHYKLYL